MDILSEAWNQWSARGTNYLSVQVIASCSIRAAEAWAVDVKTTRRQGDPAAGYNVGIQSAALSKIS